jgi:hypothetical protein
MYRDAMNVEFKCIVTPEIIGASGKEAKGLKKNLEAVPRKNLKIYYKR